MGENYSKLKPSISFSNLPGKNTTYKINENHYLPILRKKIKFLLKCSKNQF